MGHMPRRYVKCSKWGYLVNGKHTACCMGMILLSGFKDIILRPHYFWTFHAIRSIGVRNVSIILGKLPLTVTEHIMPFIRCKSCSAPISTNPLCSRITMSTSYMYPLLWETWNIPGLGHVMWSTFTMNPFTYLPISANERNTRSPSNNKKSVTCQTPLLVVFRYISFSTTGAHDPGCNAIVHCTPNAVQFIFRWKCFAM